MGQQAVTETYAGEDGGAATRSLAAVKIRAFRKQNGMTAADLAASLGVSQPSVIYWETGQKKPRTAMQGELHARGICSPNEWHEPAPLPACGANDDGQQSAA